MFLNDLISHALTASDVALNKYKLSLCFGKSDPQKINACVYIVDEEKVICYQLKLRK